MLFGGALFAVFAGLTYWWPKLFGRMLDEKLGKAAFWLVFVGFNVTFLPQFLLGLMGMPRRVYTYDSGGLWEAYNMVSTIGSYVIAVGILVFVANVIKTARTGRRAGQRSVAGRHARVVRNLTSARMEFRPHPTDHQRETAARPAASASRRRGPTMTDRDRPLGAAARGRRGLRDRPRRRLGRGRLGHGARAARGARAAADRGPRRARVDLGAAAAAGGARGARPVRARGAPDRAGRSPRGRLARVRRVGAPVRADLARAGSRRAATCATT